MKGKLYAIYKNNKHLGNETGTCPNDAIENYLIESMFVDFIKDMNFFEQYHAIPALNGIHHHLIFSKKDLN